MSLYLHTLLCWRAMHVMRVMHVHTQWRRQDFLQGGAIMSWGTHGGLQGRVQQLLDD